MPESFTPLFPAARPVAREFPAAPVALSSFRPGGGAALPELLLREARQQAHAEGYAAGVAEARAAVRAEVETLLADARRAHARALDDARGEVAGLLQALGRAAGSLERTAVATTAELADELVTAVGALTSAALGHELRAGGDGPLDALRRAGSAIPPGHPVTVALSEQDYAQLAALGVPGELDGRPLIVLADPGLARGDAVATSAATRVEARLAQAVERAVEVLGS